MIDTQREGGLPPPTLPHFNVLEAYILRMGGCTTNPTLAFTRYCFTSNLDCGNQSSFDCSSHLQSLPYCNTISRPLRNIRPPTNPPFVCHTPYTIGDGNIVWRPNPTAVWLLPTRDQAGATHTMDRIPKGRVPSPRVNLNPLTSVRVNFSPHCGQRSYRENR